MSWLSRGAGDRGDQPGRDERSGARHLDGGLSGSDPGKAPPPLTARASRPSAVRLRGSAVKVLGAVAALVLAFAFVHAFVLEPARATAPAKRAHKPSEGTVRPTEVITGQPASYDRLAPRLPDPRTQAEAVVPAVAATPAPSATVLMRPRKTPLRRPAVPDCSSRARPRNGVRSRAGWSRRCRAGLRRRAAATMQPPTVLIA
jgi:hypothetical protein